MKFALCNELFESWNTDKGFDFERVIPFVAECGYDGIEIAPFTMASDARHISASQRVAVRKRAEQAGLEISGLHWLLARTQGYYLTSPDPVLRQKTADYLLELVRLCDDLGGKFMVLGSPKERNLLPGVTLEQAHGYATEVLTRLIPLLERTGITLALEPLSSMETDVLATSAEAVELVRRIGAPKQIAMMLDCKAVATGEKQSIPELIRARKDFMAYFHCNDANLQGPGFGAIDFAPILAALKEIGYQGWVSVETFDYSPGIERLAGESIAYLKQMLAKS